MGVMDTMCCMSFMLYMFDCERLEENPHEIMFGRGPEIAIFEHIAPYVSFESYHRCQLYSELLCIISSLVLLLLLSISFLHCHTFCSVIDSCVFQ